MEPSKKKPYHTFKYVSKLFKHIQLSQNINKDHVDQTYTYICGVYIIYFISQTIPKKGSKASDNVTEMCDLVCSSDVNILARTCSVCKRVFHKTYRKTNMNFKKIY